MEESVNYTHLTTGSSNDGSIMITSLDDDTGVLHLIGEEVYKNSGLLAHIEEYTPYRAKEHDIPCYLGPRYEEKLEELVNTLVETSTEECEIPQYVVLSDFDRHDRLFKKLATKKLRIIGTVLIFQCTLQHIALSSLMAGKEHCSIFSKAMNGMSICFTNFLHKSEMTELSWKIRFMNGRVKKDYDPKIDDLILVASCAGREKFETSSSLGRITVKRNWIDDCFKLRHDINLRPRLLYTENIDTYHCPIFYGFKIFLMGFKVIDVDPFSDKCIQLGAQMMTEANIRECTHVIINAITDTGILRKYAPTLKTFQKKGDQGTEVVDDRWFWECLALNQYLKPDSYRVLITSDGTMVLRSKVEKAELLDQSIGSKRPRVGNQAATNTPKMKRASGEAADCSITISNRSCDVINTTPGAEHAREPADEVKKEVKEDKRDMIISEFIRTEETYVKHLEVIETNYYKKIHENIEKEKGQHALKVTSLENRMMFSKIPPIRIVHQALLNELKSYEVSEKKRREQRNVGLSLTPKQKNVALSLTPKRTPEAKSFGKILLNWIGKDIIARNNENSPCGRGIIDIPEGEMHRYFVYEKRRVLKSNTNERKVSSEQNMKDSERADCHNVLKLYCTYMNTKESISEMINKCEETCIRFRSLLRLEASKKENERLTIRDLMIEPVQRLPRMILLLDAIIRKTEKRHGDLELLKHVQEAFKKATSQVNDKKRMVDQKYDFVLFLREVSGLPDNQISASKHTLVDQYIAVTKCAIENVPANTDVGLWLFALDDMIEFNEENDSVLEIAKMKNIEVPKPKTGSVNSREALEKTLKGRTSIYRHVLHIPLRAITHVVTTLESSDEIGITYVDPPPSSSSQALLNVTTDTDTNANEANSGRNEITIALRLVYEEGMGGDMESRRIAWRDTLVQHVNRSHLNFNLDPINTDSEMNDKALLQRVNVVKPQKSRAWYSKVHRVFTQRQEKNSKHYPMRKAQSQANLTPYGSKGSDSKGPRAMRDSH